MSDNFTVIGPTINSQMVYIQCDVSPHLWGVNGNRDALINDMVERLSEKVGGYRANHGTLHVYEVTPYATRIKIVAAPEE